MIAVWAFTSKNMKGNFWFLLTVIAHNIHLLVFVFIWHWSSSNFLIYWLSYLIHDFFWVNWSFTQRTRKVILCDWSITRWMYPMPTLELSRTISWNCRWLQTERTVPSFNTLMIFLHRVVQTLLTSLTMPKVLSTPNSTNPTSFTMKYLLLLNFIIIEMTDMTYVICKSVLTWNTFVFADRLLGLTSQTLDVLDSKSIQMMVLLDVL